jgi:hypothetical protein
MQDNEEAREEVKDVVAQAALQDRSWMSNPQALASLTAGEAASRLSIVPIAAGEIFEGNLFFAVTDPTEKPGSKAIVIGIARDKQAYPITSTDDFQQLVSRNRLVLQSTADAFQLAEQYVRIFGSRYPQYWEKIKILTSAGEIPLEPDESLPEKLNASIQPPLVEERDDGFAIQLFSWTELGGELKRFDFQISKEGNIAVKETLVGDGLGKHWLPK